MSNITRRDRQSVSLRPASGLEFGTPYRDQEETLDVRVFLEKLLKRKYLILIVFLIVMVPAAIAMYLATPLYKSTALIQVNPDSVQVLPYRDVADSPTSGATYEDYMGTQEQMLRGRSLIARVAERLRSDEFSDNPARLEASILGEEFDVRKIERSQLFELSYRAVSPEVAAVVVNLFAEEYGKQNLEMRQKSRDKAQQDLEQELSTLLVRYQGAEQEMNAYARANDILALEPNQVDPNRESLSVLNQQVADANAQLAVARASLETAQSVSLSEFPESLITGQIGQLDGRVFQLEQELQTLRTRYGENWPAVIERREELALVRRQLDQERAAALGRRQQQARLDLQGAEARYTILSQSFDEQRDLVNRINEASVEYNILRREVETNRNLYDGLLERLRQTGIMAGFQFGNVEVVEAGFPTLRPDSPKVLQNLGLAAMLALGLGVSLVILQDFWDNSITSLEEAEQLAPLPSLGSVPLIKELKSRPAFLSTRTNGHFSNGNGHAVVRGHAEASGTPSPFFAEESSLPLEVTESIRAICASILLSRSDERPRVIVVTSAAPAEGKTTLATHLGMAFANAGSSTLLVEADLRKPDLSRSFSVGEEDGLSLYLAGHVSPLPKVHHTDVRNLSVTAAGPRPPNPVALLQSDRMVSFLKTAAADYQIVILDAPPLLSFADARVLGTEADGVVLVVRAGRTARNLVRRAWGMLDSSGANVLGMVLNGAEQDGAELLYSRYYEANARTPDSTPA